jgi:sphingolipid 4-desaturase/C4-monooxygenase
MGATVTKHDFSISPTTEPHATRRKLILEKHPEIKQLYGPDINTFYVILAFVATQLFFAVHSDKFSGWQFWLSAWLVGGAINHSLSLANHELSHNLCFRDTIWNELLAIAVNCAQGLPSGITFKKYHLEHHYYQGVDGIDVDIPTDFEGKVFNTTLRKVFWAFLQPLFYAIRPLLVKPKKPTFMEMLNSVVVFSFNFMLYRFVGIHAVVYNIASTLLGMGLHPVAGHFIAEHYEFVNSQETYSYYGPLNWISFNVGYHNEHHDFPKVAGVNLPKIRAIAPEFYENMKQHESWTKVIWNYIMREDVGPYSRVKRMKKGDLKDE